MGTEQDLRGHCHGRGSARPDDHRQEGRRPGAAKHGVVGLAKSMANELARHNIRVNTVHPTGVNTPMGTGLGALDPLLAKDPNLGPIYMNTLAVDPIEPRDVSNAVLFLASDEARYVTGLEFTVDAGCTIRWDGFRRVTRGYCCCQTAYTTPIPRSLHARSSGVRMAVIIVATAYPAPEHREEVIAAFEEAIGKVHAEEDGCELYALHEGPDGRLVMIEKYASDDAVAAHRAGAGLAALREALGGKLSAPMDVQVLAPHPAGSPAKGAL